MIKTVASVVAVTAVLSVLGAREMLTHSDRTVGFLMKSDYAPAVCAALGVKAECAARVLAKLEADSNAAK